MDLNRLFGKEDTTKNGLLTVDLLTVDGRPVTTIYMPNFQAKPNMVFWGERFFFLRTEDQRYYEGWIWTATMGSPTSV